MQGSLSDVDLPELLQTLCTRQRRAQLHLQHSGEEGTICIDRGKVFHAATGTLRGEDAFYRLLTWNRANFRTAELLDAGRQTIAKPWRQLLLEGTVQVDEASRKETRDHDRAADWVLEERLLDVLAGCDRSLQSLATREVFEQPLKALEVLQDLLDELLLAASRILEEDYAAVAPLWQSREGECAAAPMPRVQWREGRVYLAPAIRLYRRWPGEKTQRSLAFRDLGRGIVSALERYLALPSSRFATAEVAESWQATSRLFLEELTGCLEAIDF